MALPDALYDKQIKLLSELFMERKGDKKLIELNWCEDIEMGIYEILDSILLGLQPGSYTFSLDCKQ